MYIVQDKQYSYGTQDKESQTIVLIAKGKLHSSHPRPIRLSQKDHGPKKISLALRCQTLAHIFVQDKLLKSKISEFQL